MRSWTGSPTTTRRLKHSPCCRRLNLETFGHSCPRKRQLTPSPSSKFSQTSRNSSSLASPTGNRQTSSPFSPATLLVLRFSETCSPPALASKECSGPPVRPARSWRHTFSIGWLTHSDCRRNFALQTPGAESSRTPPRALPCVPYLRLANARRNSSPIALARNRSSSPTHRTRRIRRSKRQLRLQASAAKTCGLLPWMKLSPCVQRRSSPPFSRTRPPDLLRFSSVEPYAPLLQTGWVRST